ncbi:MAG: FAD-binding oxidoreductase [Limisphaerales bacterium]
MLSTQQLATLNAATCEVAYDNLTCQLTPRTPRPIRLCRRRWRFPKVRSRPAPSSGGGRRQGIAVTPRGAGTGLSGGAIGEGLIIDFAKHQPPDSLILIRTAVPSASGRRGAGPAEQLSQAARIPVRTGRGNQFAATLGGMIANDSSGSHTPVYGTTGMHVNELQVVLADGSVVKVGPGHDSLQRQRNLVEDLVSLNALKITERFPPGLLKRWPGYGLARALESPQNLLRILTGSEGTLAAIVSAELKIVPLPEARGVGLVFFASVTEAMQATEKLLELKPAAIEHIDRPLFDQTRGQKEFQAARDLLQLDSKPCESILIVEFFEDVKERLVLLKKKKLACAS